jgi:hypothetical protein
MAVLLRILMRGLCPCCLTDLTLMSMMSTGLEDRQLGLDALGLIHYPEDTVVYGGISFGVALSPQELLRRQKEYETHLNREDFGLCWVVHRQIASVIYRGLTGHSWLIPHCLTLSVLDELECPECEACCWGSRT